MISTFKTFSPSLLKEVLLTAIVWYVPGILPYLPEWVDLEPPYTVERYLVQIFVRLKVYSPLWLALSKDGCVLRHFLLRHRWPVWESRVLHTGAVGDEDSGLGGNLLPIDDPGGTGLRRDDRESMAVSEWLWGGVCMCVCLERMYTSTAAIRCVWN